MRASVAACVALVLTSCSSAGVAGPGASPQPAPAPTPDPAPGVVTLSPLPPPPSKPPTGRLYADLRQSSRDAALDRFEVWIANDTRRDVDPTLIRYTDPRFRAPVQGERLRLDPARSERGYPLALPDHPACGERPGRARVLVRQDGRSTLVPVTDEADVVARYVASRCLELAVGRVATLRFADTVPADHPGADSTGTLTLVVRPTGVLGHVLRLDSVGGTPLLGSADGQPWEPAVTVHGDGGVRRIRLAVRPARCDDHVFLEAAGATAFLVSLHLDGRPGQLVVRMSPSGARAAIGFARDSCGFGGS